MEEDSQIVGGYVENVKSISSSFSAKSKWRRLLLYQGQIIKNGNSQDHRNIHGKYSLP